MADFDEALNLVASNFRGVRDKSGAPYVLHCLRVMAGVDSMEAKIVAVMHDLVEDTPVTIDDLRQRGFAETVLKAVELVTHHESDSYADYVVQIKANAIAREVKLADLRDNLNPERALLRGDRTDRDAARLQKYLLSYQFLTNRLDESSYRQRMASLVPA